NNGRTGSRPISGRSMAQSTRDRRTRCAKPVIFTDGHSTCLFRAPSGAFRSAPLQIGLSFLEKVRWRRLFADRCAVVAPETGKGGLMGGGARPVATKAEARSTVTRKSRKVTSAADLQLELRLAEALEREGV